MERVSGLFRPKISIFAAIALLAVVLTVLTVLASRSSAVGAVKAAKKGCVGCAAPRPAADEDEPREILVVQAGQRVTFTGSRPLAPGDENFPRWQAAFGSVTTDGEYLAPATVPSDGIDTVSYLNFDEDFDFSVTIRIVPADDPSSIPPEARVWENVGSEPTSYPLPVEDPEPNGEAMELVFGNEPTTPIEVTDIEEIVPEDVNGQTVCKVPATAVVSSDRDLAVYAQSASHLQRGRREGVLPKPSWAGAACEVGLKATIGEMNRTVDVGREPSGTITVTAEIKAEVKRVFGIELAVNSIHPVYKEVSRYREWWNKDVYKCVNDSWKFMYSRQCSRTGVSYTGWTPAWAAVVNGNAGGQIQWTEWACRNI